MVLLNHFKYYITLILFSSYQHLKHLTNSLGRNKMLLTAEIWLNPAFGACVRMSGFSIGLPRGSVSNRKEKDSVVVVKGGANPIQGSKSLKKGPSQSTLRNRLKRQGFIKFMKVIREIGFPSDPAGFCARFIELWPKGYFEFQMKSSDSASPRSLRILAPRENAFSGDMVNFYFTCCISHSGQPDCRPIAINMLQPSLRAQRIRERKANRAAKRISAQAAA